MDSWTLFAIIVIVIINDITNLWAIELANRVLSQFRRRVCRMCVDTAAAARISHSNDDRWRDESNKTKRSGM